MALTRISYPRGFSSATALFLVAATIAASPVLAQEEGPDAPETEQPGYSSLNVVQPKGTRELQNALQRLALNPADIDALIDGGNAALLLGDPQAAIGFFARADEMAPGNGRVKAGLGSGILLNENPYEALRLFEEAKRLGVAETVFAADRGLAYDLVGNFNAAQADYELALRRGGDDETIRRYALSLGISGDRAAAEAQLDPLLRKRDAAAWRTRAFVLAVTGDPQGAIDIANATMPKRMAASIEPFFRFMGRLTPAQQAAAAHFGQFPQSAAIGKDDPRNRQYASIGTPRARPGRADAGLIPAGEPLGPTADSNGRKTAKVDKSSRRRPGNLSRKDRDAIALAQAKAAVQPVPVQARAPGPVPPPDLLISSRGNPSTTIQPLPGQVTLAQAPASVPAPAPAPAPPTAQPTAPNRVPDGTKAVLLAGVTELPRPDLTPPWPDGTKAVLMPGMRELPRPGFSSVPPASTATPPPPTATVQPADQTAGSQAATQLATVQQPAAQQSTGQQTTTAALAPTSPSGGFDLARIGPPAPSLASASTDAAPPPVVAQPAPTPTPEPERISLSAVIASISVPPQELAPDQNAVDITKLKPAAPKIDPKVAEAKKLEAKKAEEKKAAAKKAAAKPAPPKHPKRYWVQVAGGANRADLAKEWKRLTGEAPALFKGKQGWWTPLNATNRLLTGPFSGPNEAQAFVNTLSKSKVSGFTFTSPEGQEVTKLGG